MEMGVEVGRWAVVVDDDERCLEGFDCDGDQTPARLSQAEGGPPVGLGGNIQRKKIVKLRNTSEKAVNMIIIIERRISHATAV